MENVSFQSQLVSVLEVLAKAALAEINRRVDDGCALLRVEMTQSQRDITVLKRKCDLLEAELKRSRIRRRMRSRYAAAAQRFPPLVQIAVDRQTDAVWEGEAAVENLQSPQPPDLVLIKQERADEDTGEDMSAAHASQQEEPYQADGAHCLPNTCHSFPDEEPIGSRDEPELTVKPEEGEGPEVSAALIGADHLFMVGQADGQLWPSSQGGDAPWFPYAQQYEQTAPPTSQAAAQAAAQHAAPPVVRRRRSQEEGVGPAPCHISQLHHVAGGGWLPRRPAGRFGCSYCGRAFSRHCQLQEHLRSHTGERPFSCGACGRCFSKQCNLVRHAVVHSGEKPFGCPACGKRFTQRSSLKSHQKTAH